MRFDAQQGDLGIVYDANGVEVPHAVRGDLDTGLVERALVDSEGTIQSYEGPDGIMTARTVIERHPAPLYLKPLEAILRHKKKTRHA